MSIELGGDTGSKGKKFVTTKDKKPGEKFGGIIKLLDNKAYQKLKFRFNPKRKIGKRYPTGIESLDTVFGGGLPYGLTTFYGTAGSGKSMIARNISMKHKTLYLTCEVTTDAPDHKDFPNVTTVDYTRYLPNPKKALQEVFSMIDHENPDLVVIDSMTTFFSRSRKALPESDVREMVSKLHVACDQEIPIIGISELRGTGFKEAPAGGQGVLHGCSMLVRFNRNLIRWETHKRMYGKEFGEMVYTIQPMKDKFGLANVFEHEVIIDEYGGLETRHVHEQPLEFKEENGKKK